MALSDKQIKEIYEILQKSEKPLFFFDDDPDGLSSFLLLYRHFKKGTGVVVKSTPQLDEKYLPKVEECMPDVIVVLDKPLLAQSFIDAMKQICDPIILWIDHHPPQKNTGVQYYNPRVADDADNRPTNYWCWQVVKEDQPKDIWIAMAGCIGDWFLPEFTPDFCQQFPKLMKTPVATVQEALYETKIGRVTRVFSFIQKGPTKKTMNCIKILTRVTGPDDFLEQKTSQGKFLWKWFAEVNKDYEELKKSVTDTKESLLLFTYTEDKMSFTSDLSNELIYRYPDKTILICRQKGLEMKCSIRDTHKVLPPAIQKSLKDLTGYGGGHDHACGLCVNIDDFSVFLERLKKELKS